MPTKKLDDTPWDKKKNHCRHPTHLPPTMRVFESGTYEHTCPACGHITVFTISRPTFKSPPLYDMNDMHKPHRCCSDANK